MLLLAPLLTACSGTAPAEPAPEPVEAVASIGGDPILHHPIVIGAISAEAVDAGIGSHQAEIDACYQAASGGMVAVRFKIAADGSVTEARTKSTSLRHPETEACVVDVVSKARFPALERGGVAIVTYPFSFGG